MPSFMSPPGPSRQLPVGTKSKTKQKTTKIATATMMLTFATMMMMMMMMMMMPQYAPTKNSYGHIAQIPAHVPSIAIKPHV